VRYSGESAGAHRIREGPTSATRGLRACKSRSSQEFGMCWWWEVRVRELSHRAQKDKSGVCPASECAHLVESWRLLLRSRTRPSSLMSSFSLTCSVIVVDAQLLPHMHKKTVRDDEQPSKDDPLDDCHPAIPERVFLMNFILLMLSFVERTHCMFFFSQHFKVISLTHGGGRRCTIQRATGCDPAPFK
jgi:hypothetical protein